MDANLNVIGGIVRVWIHLRMQSCELYHDQDFHQPIHRAQVSCRIMRVMIAPLRLNMRHDADVIV